MKTSFTFDTEWGLQDYMEPIFGDFEKVFNSNIGQQALQYMVENSLLDDAHANKFGMETMIRRVSNDDIILQRTIGARIVRNFRLEIPADLHDLIQYHVSGVTCTDRDMPMHRIKATPFHMIAEFRLENEDFASFSTEIPMDIREEMMKRVLTYLQFDNFSEMSGTVHPVYFDENTIFVFKHKGEVFEYENDISAVSNEWSTTLTDVPEATILVRSLYVNSYDMWLQMVSVPQTADEQIAFCALMKEFFDEQFNLKRKNEDLIQRYEFAIERIRNVNAAGGIEEYIDQEIMDKDRKVIRPDIINVEARRERLRREYEEAQKLVKESAGFHFATVSSLSKPIFILKHWFQPDHSVLVQTDRPVIPLDLIGDRVFVNILDRHGLIVDTNCRIEKIFSWMGVSLIQIRDINVVELQQDYELKFVKVEFPLLDSPLR